MKKIPDTIKGAARNLRKNQTEAEKLLWICIKNRKIGYKFQRQFCLYVFTEDSGQERYVIPDFYCSEKNFIIEIDGSVHKRKDVYELDNYKEDFLQKIGYSILRLKNDEILDNLEKSINKIKSTLKSLQLLSLEKRENSRVSLSLCENGTQNTKKTGFIMKNESFHCENCGKEVSQHPTGSARNHCPFCLYSKHLDKEFPGDRASECHGLMRPTGKDYHKNKDWMLIHECQKCGKKISNKLAEDDSVEVYGEI